MTKPNTLRDLLRGGHISLGEVRSIAKSIFDGEMTAAGGVAYRIEASRLPLLAGALEYAAQGITFGGSARNRSYLQDKVRIADGID